MMSGAEDSDKMAICASLKVVNQGDCGPEKGHFQNVGTCWADSCCFQQNILHRISKLRTDLDSLASGWEAIAWLSLKPAN